MINLILSTILLASMSGQNTPQAPSPGALRLIRTASALTSSSVAPPRQLTVAEAWIATARADIGAEPPQGPPDSVTATPQLMATWASSAIDAAAASPLASSAVAYAQVQTETIARLLQDVDATGTEPPDPKALARVLLLASELALVSGDTTAAGELAHRAAATRNWRENITIHGITSLSTVLARLKDCQGITKLSQSIPPSQLPEVIAAAATQPTCEALTAELIKNPALGEDGRTALLIDQLNRVHASAATDLLLAQSPEVMKTPALRLTIARTFFEDGKFDRGLEIIGGNTILERLQGRDRALMYLAMAQGHARNGDFEKALALIPQIGGIDTRFYALVAIQSRMLAQGAIEPNQVLDGIKTLRSVRTTALDQWLPTIATRPTPMDRVMDALLQSGRFELGATLLTPLFSPSNQSGDDWLDRRIALLARALANSKPQEDDAWATLIEHVSWCARVDQQVRALCTIAMCWQSARANDPLPDTVRSALSKAIEAIATGNNQRPQRTP